MEPLRLIWIKDLLKSAATVHFDLEASGSLYKHTHVALLCAGLVTCHVETSTNETSSNASDKVPSLLVTTTTNGLRIKILRHVSWMSRPLIGKLPLPSCLMCWLYYRLTTTPSKKGDGRDKDGNFLGMWCRLCGGRETASPSTGIHTSWLQRQNRQKW